MEGIFNLVKTNYFSYTYVLGCLSIINTIGENMEKLISNLGSAIAILGFILCAVAGGARLMGMFHVSSYEAMTLLQAGAALMVAACMLRLYFPEKE